MKKIAFSLMMTAFAGIMVQAQSQRSVPFVDDFESYAAFTTFNAASGYSGDMSCYDAHGLNRPGTTSRSKAILSQMSNFNRKDSLISPQIGPMPSTGGTLAFSYRVLDQAAYPSTRANWTTGDAFRVLLSANGGAYTQILNVNSTSYPGTGFGFQQFSIPLDASYSGAQLRVKFIAEKQSVSASGNRDFFVDIDSFSVIGTLSGIGNTNKESDWSVYPNPSRTGILNFELPTFTQHEQNLQIFDAVGKCAMSIPVQSGVKQINNLDISTLPKGMYIARLKSDVAEYTEKIFVE